MMKRAWGSDGEWFMNRRTGVPYMTWAREAQNEVLNELQQLTGIEDRGQALRMLERARELSYRSGRTVRVELNRMMFAIIRGADLEDVLRDG